MTSMALFFLREIPFLMTRGRDDDHEVSDDDIDDGMADPVCVGIGCTGIVSDEESAVEISELEPVVVVI